MNKNTFEGIQYFIAVAKLGSITLVAKSLSIDYKTIKRKVQLLEKTLNTRLIDSSHQGTGLTSEGWKFYQEVSNGYMTFKNIVDDRLTKKITYKKNSINILLQPVTSLLFSQHIIPKVYESFPELNIHISIFDISYLLAYGSHIKTLLNSFNIISIDDTAIQMINPDEWRLAFSIKEKTQLYAHQNYISKLGISDIKDLNKTNLIIRTGTSEENGLIKLQNKQNLNIEEVQFSNNLSAKNDLIKAHLANQSLGVALLSPMLFNCGQNIELVKIFPEYEYLHEHAYTALYKPNDITKKYIKRIIDISKKFISDVALDQC